MKNMSAPLMAFVTEVSEYIDKMKKGEKLDRKEYAAKLAKKHPDIGEADSVTLLGVIVRCRKDLDSKKGKEGGTFKL